MGNIGAIVSQKGYDVNDSADRLKVFSSTFQTLKISSVHSVTTKKPPSNSANFTADASTNVLTSAGHGLENGDIVNFSTDGTLPEGLLDYETDTLYYVIEKTTDTFKVSLTSGGSAVDITSAGSGTHTWWTDIYRFTINHNLGYYAPCIFIYNGSTTLGQNNSFQNSDGIGQQSSFLMKNYENHLDVNIYSFFDDGVSNPGDTLYFTVYFFLDDFRTVEEDNINTTTTSGSEGDNYGFRVSKEGIDVKTGDDVDMIISSSFFNNIVHKKGIEYGDPASISISHNLGYVPAVLMWERLATSDYMSQCPFSIDSDDVVPSGFGGANYYIYYIIFKSKLDG